MGNGCSCIGRDKSPKNGPIQAPEDAQFEEMVQSVEMHQSQVPQRQKIKETIALKRSLNEQGDKCLNDYVIRQKLGEGQFGKVRLAEKGGHQYAIKILQKSKLKRKREFVKDKDGNTTIKDALMSVQREIAIMKKLRHPNIIRLYEVIDNPDSDKIYMVMEFAEKGQLIDWNEDDEVFIKMDDTELNEDVYRRIFRDIIVGIYQLHSHHIVHRDIKPQNILFDKLGNAKIADFGVSQIVHGDVDSTQGTYHFMAPETYNQSEYCGMAADIWSMGVSFYCFINMTAPFNGGSIEDIMEQIQTKELEFPPETNEGLVTLLKKCLTRDPHARAKIADLIDDPWINYQSEPLKDVIHRHDQQVEVTDDEISNAFSLHTFILIKGWAGKWKNKLHNTGSLPEEAHQDIVIRHAQSELPQ